MSPERVTAFSDGVFAVIITITVLDIHAPPSPDLAALKPLLPVLASYALSFAYVGIYWNNHHHMFQAVKHVNGKTMWLNLHLLFWLSLFPFTTSWVGGDITARWPTVIYGAVLFAAGLAYIPLARSVAKTGGVIDRAVDIIGKNPKMPITLVIYLLGIGLTFLHPWLGDACYLAVALMWFWPSRRIEAALADDHKARNPSGAH